MAAWEVNRFITINGADSIVELNDEAILTNKTLTAPIVNRSLLAVAREKWTVSSDAISTTSATAVALDPYTVGTSAWIYTGNATNTWVPNFGHLSSTSNEASINTWLAVGESLTVSVAAYISNSAAFASQLKIDGQTAFTPNWQGALAPTSGNASSYDVYTYTIIKTAISSGTPTYVVYAARTRFA